MKIWSPVPTHRTPFLNSDTGSRNNMTLAPHLARRYMKGRSRFLLNGSNLLSLGGIVFSVFALLVVLSIMNGFDHDIMDRIIGTKSEMRIHSRQNSIFTDYPLALQQLRSNPLVQDAAPVFQNDLMLVHNENMAATVNFGIMADEHKKIARFLQPVPDDINKRKDPVLRGIVDGTANTAMLEENGILLGMDLAMQLGVSVGDTIQVVSPSLSIATPLGMIPKTKHFRLIGTFVTGMPEYDRMYSFLSLGNGRFFSAHPEGVDYVEIRTRDRNTILRTSAQLQKQYPQYEVEDWSHFDPNLYSAMKMEKYVMLAVLSLMMLITSFNLTANLMKLIVLKRREIGILKALGSPNRQISLIFFMQGCLISLLGIALGCLLAFLLLQSQIQFHWFRIPMGTLPMIYLPVHMQVQDFLTIIGISLAITLLSIFAPLRKLRTLSPIDTIR